MRRPPQPEALDRARGLRRTATPAEVRLWSLLRGRRLDGAKFRRQVWLTGFIVDFYCAEAGLVVELDGGHHASHTDDDDRRTRRLEQEGFRVIRFWNDAVMDNPEGVAHAIGQALTLPPLARRVPPSPLQGEG